MKYFLSVIVFFIAISINATDKYPLNSSIDVVHYEFSLYLSDSYDLIRGEAIINLIHTGETSSISFDLKGIDSKAKGMTVEEVRLNDKSVKWTHENNRIIIEPGLIKEVGESSAITIRYYGVPADGLIISTNKYGDRTFFADNWPDRARNWIPCIDHPSDKAFVDFKVYAPAQYKVVSNGYLFEESLLPEGIKFTHWKEEISIPTKVMVIGVARFASQLAGRVGGTDIWTYVYPENREAGFFDYSIATEPFVFFSEKIGPYPYEKLANVQSKTIFGGMENAGCIFYSERSVSGKGSSERLIAHEIAHQWFGNSVTEKDWHHVWLSEGFATYLTTLYFENKEGVQRLYTSMNSSRQRVINAYKNNPAPVIDTTITNFMRLLSTNSYQKGAWVLHMLRNEIGDDTFWNGLRTYYARYRNRNALTSDFVNTIEEISGRDLSDFFYQWLYLPGFPEISISWTYSPRKKETTVQINQLQEENTFVFPLELEIITASKSVIEKVEINAGTQSVVVKTESRPEEIVLDPSVKLLFELKTIE